MSARRWLSAGVLGGLVAATAYSRRALTLDGALGAAVVGCVVFARGGWPAAGALLAFFTSSSVLSKLGETGKQRSPQAQAKGSRRDVWQVLANGAVATVSLGVWGPTRGGGPFIGALACAAADTWASELGQLAPRPPRLITTGRTVPAGTSGGVSAEGLLASFGGALTVGLAWAVLGGGRRGALTALVAGTLGCAVDSVLGATLQAAYRCPVCGSLTEQPQHAGCRAGTDLVRGWRWMTNDAVNAVSTLAGAAIGAACGRVFNQAASARLPARAPHRRQPQSRLLGRPGGGGECG